MPISRSSGVEIYGVSTDTHFTHKAWHDTSDTIAKVQYPLVGDPTHALARNFGVLIEEEGIAYRGTFVVDPGGRIKIVEINDNGIGRDAKELLRKVQAAQYVASHPGEVCPAKWTPGERTLRRRSIWSARSEGEDHVGRRAQDAVEGLSRPAHPAGRDRGIAR